MAAARRTGDRTSEARALANLGAAFAAAGHDRDAVGPFQASLAAFRRLADRPREEATLCNAIPVMIKVGMVHEAMAAVQRLLEIAEQPQRRAAAYAWEQQLRSRTPPPASSRPPLPRMPRKWMELGFRDLPHSDVMARAEQGRRCLEEVLSVLSKHAAATEKHAELLEKAAKRVEAGPGSSVETLDLAVAAMAAQLQHAVADEREAATVVTTAVCSGMGELKAAHGAQLKQWVTKRGWYLVALLIMLTLRAQSISGCESAAARRKDRARSTYPRKATARSGQARGGKHAREAGVHASGICLCRHRAFVTEPRRRPAAQRCPAARCTRCTAAGALAAEVGGPAAARHFCSRDCGFMCRSFQSGRIAATYPPKRAARCVTTCRCTVAGGGARAR